MWSCFLMANMPTKCLASLPRREQNIQKTNRQGDAHAQSHSTARCKLHVRHLFKTAASCTTGARTEASDFLENMVGKCLFKTVCVDKYFFIVSCLQSPSFVVTYISAFYTADKRACRAPFSTPKQFGLVV